MENEILARLEALELGTFQSLSPGQCSTASTSVNSTSRPSGASSPSAAESVLDSEQKQSEKSDHLAGEVYCEIRSTPEKGQSLFATRTIRSGTLIFSEEPLITLSRRNEESHVAIEDAFSAISKKDKKKYLALFDAEKSRMSAVVSIYYSNCYSIDSFVRPDAEDNLDEGGSCIGALASRINHSCLPNVCFSYMPRSAMHPRGQMRFHAIKPIPRGKELVSNYVKNIFEVAANRRQNTLLHYGFKCACESCLQPTHFWAKSDERRRTMKQAIQHLKGFEREWTKRQSPGSNDGPQNLRLCQDALLELSTLEEALIKEHLAYTPLANVYRSCAKWARRRGDSPRPWLLKELDICTIMYGKHSLRSMGVGEEIAMLKE